jgi:5'-nucleotidase
MTLRFLALFALLLPMAWFAACNSDTGADAGAPDSGAAARDGDDALEGAADGQKPVGSVDTVVLAMSDWRGQLEPLTEDDTSGVPQTYGGLDALAWYFANERVAATGKAVFFLTTGGTFGATPPIASASGDVPIVFGLNLLGATADTLGVHDFDRGFAALRALIDPASFRVVSTNLAHVADELGPKPVVPMYLFELDQGRGKVTFAILGLTGSDLSSLQTKANLGTIEVRAPLYDEANRAAKNARLLGADVVIALAGVGAVGLDLNGQPAGPLGDLASRLSQVDLLVGGATDQPVNAVTPGGMRVVQTRLRGRAYARIVLRVADGTPTIDAVTMVDPQAIARTGALCDAGADAGPCACGGSSSCPSGAQCSDASLLCERTLVTPSAEAGAILAAAANALQARSDTRLSKVIATDGGAAVFASANTGAAETAIGDLVADALLAKYKDIGVQVALVEASCIRAGLPSPYDSPAIQRFSRDAATPPVDLVFGDAFTVIPRGDAAVIRQIAGETLHLALERALSRVPAADPGFLQVAGLRLTYSTALDAGARIKTLVLDDGTPIPRDGSTFTVALTDRISAGDDGYAMLAETAPTPSRDLLVDVLTEYLKNRTTVAPPSTFPRIVKVP